MKCQYHSGTKRIAPEQIGTLIISLSGRGRLLASDFEAEEERTQCRDRRDPAYSFLSKVQSVEQRMRLGMRCRLSPTADVPSHTSGVAMGQQQTCGDCGNISV